jgi:hypothetical protein
MTKEEEVTEETAVKTLFSLGCVVATRGAAEATTEEYQTKCLHRHLSGDWGHVCDEDKATNDEAVKAGFRILSAYPLDESKPCKGFGDTLWIITEADRSITTFLLPDEYEFTAPAPPRRRDWVFPSPMN